MPQVVVERLDHLGVIAGVIKDLGLVELIDSRIEVDEKEEITTGEAITGMILNGLGFSDRPMSLTPQFFQNKPLAVLFRPGVEADHFNRFKLGRSLDKVFGYGCDVLFSEISMDVCRQEAVDLRFHSLDTTTFSLTGAYVPDSDESAIRIVRGYSKDHRPDLKQVVLETIVSQNGGIPLVCKSWDGNASDTKIFEARAADLIAQFQGADAPRYLVADAKLYTKDNAPNLSRLSFITRLPETIKVVGHSLNRPGTLRLGFYRCLTGLSARRTLPLWDLSKMAGLSILSKQSNGQKKRYIRRKSVSRTRCKKPSFIYRHNDLTPNKKHKRPSLLSPKRLKYHRIEKEHIKPHIRYAKKGRPTPKTPIKDIRWQITADILPDQEKIQAVKQRKATFVSGSNIPHAHLSDQDIIQAYKGQKAVETGFRFLKDPLFFVSSLFLKKPSRIQSLTHGDDPGTVGLFYCPAPNACRLSTTSRYVARSNRNPTAQPTLRWLFQVLDGIHRVILHTPTQTYSVMDGLTDLRIKILRLFGKGVCQIYLILLLRPAQCQIYRSFYLFHSKKTRGHSREQ